MHAITKPSLLPWRVRPLICLVAFVGQGGVRCRTPRIPFFVCFFAPPHPPGKAKKKGGRRQGSGVAAVRGRGTFDEGFAIEDRSPAP